MIYGSNAALARTVNKSFYRITVLETEVEGGHVDVMKWRKF